MKKLTDKNFIQKIVIAILIVLSFNFAVPTFSSAVDLGGILLVPVTNLITTLGDAILFGLEWFMYDGGVGTAIKSGNLFDGLYTVSPKEFKDSANKSDDLYADMRPSAEDKKVEIKNASFFPNYVIPVISYGPEKIFAGQIPALDGDFINPKDYQNTFMNEKSLSRQLQSTISSWYIALRNFVIVALLSILLYVAIRMIISSTASDKAKYKQMLMDWIIALCLLFFLHYIMAFTMSFVRIISESIGNNSSICIAITGTSNDVELKTTLSGYCRLMLQSSDGMVALIYLILYIATIVYTIKFTWEYIKRAITLAFLTLMAPLVILTYPIDKIGDGKAQAFNMWLKEYVFNALLQPFHLIIYTIFMGSAIALAVNNPVYAIFCFAFITPAEKLLRKFFGFDKASSAGSSFAGGFGGAAAFNAVKGAVQKGAHAVASASSGNSAGGNNNIRQHASVEDDSIPKDFSSFTNDKVKDTDKNMGRRQAMVDAYDEKYGTNEWDAQEREALSREAYNQNDNHMQYSDEELAQIYRESGYSEDQINDLMGYTKNAEQLEQQPEISSNPQDAGLALAYNEISNPQDAGFTLTQNRQEQPQPKSEKERRKLGRAAVRRAIFSGKNLKNAGKFLGKTAIRAASATTMGAIGLGMGITGDNLEDVFTYGAAGIGLGATVGADMVIGAGKKLYNGTERAVDFIGEAYNEGYYGVNKAQSMEQAAQFREDEKNKEYFASAFPGKDGLKASGDELKQVMKQASYYNNAKITDLSKIKKAIKLENGIKEELDSNTELSEDEKAEMARQQAVTIAKFANSSDFQSNKFKTDAKYRNSLREHFKNGLRHSNSNLSNSEVEANSEKMMKLLFKYQNVSYSNDK